MIWKFTFLCTWVLIWTFLKSKQQKGPSILHSTGISCRNERPGYNFTCPLSVRMPSDSSLGLSYHSAWCSCFSAQCCPPGHLGGSSFLWQHIPHCKEWKPTRACLEDVALWELLTLPNTHCTYCPQIHLNWNNLHASRAPRLRGGFTSVCVLLSGRCCASQKGAAFFQTAFLCYSGRAN